MKGTGGIARAGKKIKKSPLVVNRSQFLLVKSSCSVFPQPGACHPNLVSIPCAVSARSRMWARGAPADGQIWVVHVRTTTTYPPSRS
jgi:hypothetical protein